VGLGSSIAIMGALVLVFVVVGWLSVVVGREAVVAIWLSHFPRDRNTKVTCT
jgi:hypothetical protein